jgi:hypothetical protein
MGRDPGLGLTWSLAGEQATNGVEEVVWNDLGVGAPIGTDPVHLLAPAKPGLLTCGDILGIHETLDLLLLGPDPAAGIRLVLENRSHC